MSDIDVTNTRSRVDTVQQCLEDIKVILENNQHIELDSRGRTTLTQVLSGEELSRPKSDKATRAVGFDASSRHRGNVGTITP